MSRALALAVFIIILAAPAHAQWGHPVQTVHDGGYAFILYSSGNIVREDSWGRRVLIDDGTGSRMIAAGNGRCYVLKNNGNIWMWEYRRWRMIDNGTGTAEIWTDWSTVYCRKNTGQVWRCVDPYRMQWQLTNGWRAAAVANFERLYQD